MKISSDYLYSKIFLDLAQFHPIDNSVYIYAHSTEERSFLVDTMITTFTNVKFIKVEELNNDAIWDHTLRHEFYLRSSKSMSDFFKLHSASVIYIDVSGINNRIAAALLNNAMKSKQVNNIKEIRVVYAEPETYDVKQFQAEGVFHDLSEQIAGIYPLPGFATIVPDNTASDFKFIALLGFEGGRFTHMVENVQPPKDNIIPVIGVPGFRLEYPFVAYWGNRIPLDETESWRRIQYTAANSIVDTYMFLLEVLRNSPSSKIKLAPIGTKPHAIGAILIAINYPKKIEIVYDNPKRNKKRTKGIGKIIESQVSKLIEENTL